MAEHSLVVGLGVTGRAVVDALARRGHDVVAVDDRPPAEARAAMAAAGVELVEAPPADRLRSLVAGAAEVLPAPGQIGRAHV